MNCFISQRVTILICNQRQINYHFVSLGILQYNTETGYSFYSYRRSREMVIVIKLNTVDISNKTFNRAIYMEQNKSRLT